MDTGQIGFFTPIAAMEEGSGFAIGSPFHIAYLALSALLVCTLVITYRHLRPGIRGKTPRRIMLLCVSLTAIGLKMSELAIMMAWGVYNVFWWPLHPCNICALLCVLFAIVPNNPTGEVLYALGIPGGMAGLLFADWIGRTAVVLNWFCLCGFVEHALLVAFPLMIISGGDFRPSMRRIWQPLAFVALCAPPVRLFNTHFGTNYWFINKPSPGSPLETWASLWGNPGYLVPFALLTLGIWTCMYLPWALSDRRRARH